MNNDELKVLALVKLSSGATLRRTRRQSVDGVWGKQQYYVSVEQLGRVRMRRITERLFRYLNDELARNKCAFHTNILQGGALVQYTHSISI